MRTLSSGTSSIRMSFYRKLSRRSAPRFTVNIAVIINAIIAIVKNFMYTIITVIIIFMNTIMSNL